MPIVFMLSICDTNKNSLLPPASEGWGKVLFSVCQSTPRRVGGYPTSGLGRGGIPSQVQVGGGYPISGPGGYPIPGPGGYPISGQGCTPSQVRGRGYSIPCSGGYPGYPPWNRKHLLRLRGGRYASCVHAGGLSCIYHYLHGISISLLLCFYTTLDHSWNIHVKLFARLRK